MDCIRYRSLVIEPLECRIAPAFVTPSRFNLSTLAGSDGFKIGGTAPGDDLGFSVSGAGDVNGDGFADLVIGAPSTSHGDLYASGSTYVIFGKAGGFPTQLDLTDLDGSDGFEIRGEKFADRSGYSVHGAGDVNGDGFADIIISAIGADPNGSYSGASYVLFGKASGFTTTLSLADLDGSNGFKIEGEMADDRSGTSVAGAGDVNGDGFADLVIGAYRAGPHGFRSGASYVVFGKASGFTTPLKVSSLDGSDGFKIQGETKNDDSGFSVSGAGDVNGDGFADVIIGAPLASPNDPFSGASYVVFGKASGFSTPLDLSSLDGSNGFKIQGQAFGDNSGLSVSSAGDMNGDGFADVIIGALEGKPNGPRSAVSYVVFGKAKLTTPLNLASLDGGTGLKIQSEAFGGSSAVRVSGAGDVNGDGLADVIMGTFLANSHGVGVGASYVVFGKANWSGPLLKLSNIDGNDGFKIPSEPAKDLFSVTVSAAGDVNRDGCDDILVGANGTSPRGLSAGVSYVIFGHPVNIVFRKDGKTASFLDSDGDRIAVTLSKGKLSQEDFVFSHGVWQELDLATKGASAFGGASVTITVKKAPGGDGRVNLGYLNATGLDLGAVTISGDLGQIDAGDADLKTPAVKTLTVGSLGAVSGTQPAGTVAPLVSDLSGSLGKLTVTGTMKGAVDITGGSLGSASIGGNLDGSAGGDFAGLLRASGNIGAVTVKGSVMGGAIASGILSEGKLGRVTIGGDLTSADTANPVTISALGKLGVTKGSDAVAIAGVNVRGNVLDARILAGFTQSFDADNSDAGIGAISVGKNWTASSVSAGVADSTGDGFGQNDTRIAGDTTSAIQAKIASITIKGTATGSTATGDFYGITAERILKATIGPTKVKLTTGAEDQLLDATNSDFRLVDFA